MTDDEKFQKAKDELHAMRGDFEEGRDTGDVRHVANGLLRLVALVEMIVDEVEAER